MSALNALASTFSPSWMSIARLVFPPRLELNSLAGSFNEAPLANVSFTTDLYVSPVQMIPSCDHVGVPGLVGFTHFTSSTTSGSASLTSLRILLKVSPRQSPTSAIISSIRSDADWPSLESDSFMRSRPPSTTCQLPGLTPGASSCNRSTLSSRQLEVGRRVVVLGAGGLDVAEPVAVVEVVRALDAGGDELPGVALVRPVLGLQAVRGAEVGPGGLDVTGVVQVLTEFELGGGLGNLRRAGRRASYDLLGRERVFA